MTGLAGRDANRFILRLPEGVRPAVKARAAHNRRSMNSEIVLMIERALSERPAVTGDEPASMAPVTAHETAALPGGVSATNG